MLSAMHASELYTSIYFIMYAGRGFDNPPGANRCYANALVQCLFSLTSVCGLMSSLLPGLLSSTLLSTYNAFCGGGFPTTSNILHVVRSSLINNDAPNFALGRQEDW